MSVRTDAVKLPAGICKAGGNGFSPSRVLRRPCPHGYTWECPTCKAAIRRAIAELGGPWYPPGTYQTSSGPWGAAFVVLADLLKEVHDDDRRHRGQTSVHCDQCGYTHLLEGPFGRRREYGRRKEDQRGRREEDRR